MEQTTGGVMPQTSSATDSERRWAALAHLSALVLALMTSWIAGVAGMLAAAVIYLIKRDDSAFASEHAREAINFNLSMFIYACVAAAIGIVLVGAMIALAHAESPLAIAIGFVGVVLGAGNAAGGYVVTERMLEMFKSSKNAKKD